MIFPEESVVSEFEPEQVWRVEICNPPAFTIRPPEVKVEVAEPVTLKLPVCTVPVAKNPLAVVVPAKSASPWTEKSMAGEVVPTPTNPVVLLMNRSSVLIEKFPVVVKLVEAPSKAMSVSAIRREVVLRSRVVPESNVNVPEVYESEASERRKDNESTESKVVASVQLDVTAISLALIVIQVPAPTARAPAVVVSPPPSKALNDPEAKLMLPPEIVRPEAEERPPEVEMEIPPSNVEVAVEEELIPPPAWRSLATERVLANVEEAATERFCVATEEEAESVPTFRFREKVEEADETRPPDGSIEKRVDVPAPRDCWTWKALPV